MGLANLTGHLIALARALPQNGLYKLHNQPLDDAHFKEPKVTGVDFPNVLLRRAVYDRNKKALIVTAEPGAIKHGETNFKIINLEPGRSYRLSIDGQEIRKIKGRDQISVNIKLDNKHDLILIEI